LKLSCDLLCSFVDGKFPRSDDRGPIEAHHQTLETDKALRFRDQTIAAPLKPLD
jgi:hypothetical protein